MRGFRQAPVRSQDAFQSPCGSGRTDMSADLLRYLFPATAGCVSLTLRLLEARLRPAPVLPRTR